MNPKTFKGMEIGFFRSGNRLIPISNFKFTDSWTTLEDIIEAVKEHTQLMSDALKVLDEHFSQEDKWQFDQTFLQEIPQEVVF